jgi:hypothetical protein
MENTIMSDAKPVIKVIEYEHLTARVDYKERILKIIDVVSGESITVHASAFGELQAIMTDIGRQAMIAQSTRRT